MCPMHAKRQPMIETGRTCSQTSRPRTGVWFSSTMPTCTSTGAAYKAGQILLDGG